MGGIWKGSGGLFSRWEPSPTLGLGGSRVSVGASRIALEAVVLGRMVDTRAILRMADEGLEWSAPYLLYSKTLANRISP